MKRLSILLFSFGLFFLQNAQAQDPMHDAAVVFAHEFCECVQPHFEHMDKDVAVALAHMPIGSEEEIEAYFTTLDQDLLGRLVSQIEPIESFAESAEYAACSEGIEDRMKGFKGKIDEHIEENPEFMQLVLDELDTSSDCQLTYAFLKIGLLSGEE